MLAPTKVNLSWGHADALDQLPRGVIVFQDADVERLGVSLVFHQEVFTGLDSDLGITVAGRLDGDDV